MEELLVEGEGMRLLKVTFLLGLAVVVAGAMWFLTEAPKDLWKKN